MLQTVGKGFVHYGRDMSDVGTSGGRSAIIL